MSFPLGQLPRRPTEEGLGMFVVPATRSIPVAFVVQVDLGPLTMPTLLHTPDGTVVLMMLNCNVIYQHAMIHTLLCKLHSVNNSFLCFSKSCGRTPHVSLLDHSDIKKVSF